MIGSYDRLMTKKTPSEAEIEQVAMVKAHLKQVEMAAQHDADEPILRVITGSLRFLLKEDNLGRAWRTSGIGGPMTFSVYCISSIDPGETLVFCGGGDLLPGLSFSSNVGGSTLEKKTLDLESLRRQTRVQFGQAKFSTVEVVEYVANALGGVHYDPAGKAARKADILRRVEAGEIASMGIRVNDRSHLHHEILSIAQAVVRSPEVERLRRWQKPDGS